MDINKLAQILDSAALNVEPVEQPSHRLKFSVDEAYAIQAASVERRYKRGEKLIGLKLGFTSKAKMEQMGVHDMIWGRLTDAMLIENGGSIILKNFIHPRAEPEICFLVKKQIDRPISLKEAQEYIGGVAAAIEIIDSRYQNFKFSLEDVIADNCSSAGLVIGNWHDVSVPVNNLMMELWIDDRVVEEGNSSAILGDPWESVVAAARLATQYGQLIPAGSVILAGAATPAVFFSRGSNVHAMVESLGTVSFQVR